MLYKKTILEKYFTDHQENLENFYPGITRDILFRNLSQLSCEEVLSSIPLMNKGVPLSYITQRHFFYNHEFIVSPAVLIPRSETEILVEKAKDEINLIQNDKLHVLDLCSGSGCIGLSLLGEITHKNIHMSFSDISSDALEINKRNYQKLKIFFNKHEVAFIQSDLFNSFDRNNLFDFIVSNPPYIKNQLHRKTVHPKVIEFEPHVALFLEDDLFDQWFDSFFKEIKLFLKPNGQAFIEGHEEELQNLERIAQKYFSDTELIKDYSGRFRFIKLKN